MRFPSRLLLLLGMAATLPASAEQVVISEIMYQPPTGKPEYIELSNITATPLDTALWKFNDGIDYTFPNFNAGASSAHLLKPFEKILISSADDATTRAAYPSIPVNVRILGPWGAGSALSNGGERLTVKDKNGVVVCTVEYSDQGKWPIAPDGTGHSLVLNDENQTIDNWRLWRSSTNRLGSPGLADPAPAATGLALNEVHFNASTGRVDWVEVRNNSLSAAQNAGLLFIASKLDFSDKVPLSGMVNPGAVAAFDLDFNPTNDGEIRVYLIDASNNVRDAVKLTRVTGRLSNQVFPAGGKQWYTDAADTKNAQNNPARSTDIVINEIMADPPSNQRDGEFIELHNKSANPVNVGGWRLDDEVDYTIPGGTTIPAGGYLVLAANATALNASYTGLSALGDWSGSLSNSGGRIQLKDANGNLADEVDYRFGGEWPELANGDGSSLELINPEADNAIGSSWRDSDESAKSSFASFSIKGGNYKRLTHGGVTDDEIQLWLAGDGHMIVRNASLKPSAGGAELFANPNVTTNGYGNVDGWRSHGNHWATFHDAEGVHLVADGGGDNKANLAEKDATGMVANTDYTLTFEARWIYGNPRLIAQSWDLSWGGTVLIGIPSNLGTPGAANSRFQAAAPPEMTGLRHSPATPPTNSTVLVTTKVSSSSPLTSVQLFHRLDNINYNGAWNTTAMVDNGTNGDVQANDGIYSAQVTLTAFGYNTAGATVEFYTRATASNGQTVDLPRGANVGEPYATAQFKRGMWVVDNQAQPTDLRRVRVVLSNYYLEALNTPDVDASGLTAPGNGGGSAAYNYKFPKHNSHYFPCTVIMNDSDVFYGAGVHKTGSPFTRTTNNSLDRGRVTLPGDRTYRGHGKIYWDNDGVGGTMMHNRIHRYLLYLCGVPANENEVLRVTRNGVAYAVRESNEVFDKDMLDRIWDNGSSGYFYEIDDAHVISENGSTRLNSIEAGWDYDIGSRPGANNPVSYHNNFVPGSRETEYDFSSLIEWNKQIETNGLGLQNEQIDRMADIQAMAAYAAVRGYSCDWDSITQGRAKNGYFYNRPSDHRWLLLHWDSDNAFQSSHINDAFIGSETNVQNFYNRPLVRRYVHYYMAQLMGQYALNGPRLSAWLAAEEAASSGYPVPTTYATWPTTLASSGTSQTRVQVMQAFIGNTANNAVFSITTTPPATPTALNVISIAGKAPPNVFRVECVGHPEGIFAWGNSIADTSPWTYSNLQLASGNNTFTFRAFDNEGLQVGNDISIVIAKSGNAPPVAKVAISPGSHNVALGEPLLIDTSASFDPEGNPLTYTINVSPAGTYTLTSPTPSTRLVYFTVPGSYSVSVTVNDGAVSSSAVNTAVTVFSTSDFSNFGEKKLDSIYTPEWTKLLDNYAPDSWYSLNETSGSLALNVTDATTKSLTNSSPQFPLITRPLPTIGTSWILQTEFVMETRQYGSFLTGLYLETMENGTLVRYAYGYDGGLNWRVYKASGAGVYGQVGATGFTAPNTVMRIRRSNNSLTFETRNSAYVWTAFTTVNLPVGSTAIRGGVFTATGPNNSAPVSPGFGVRTAFDYLLLSNPVNTADLFNNLRITEVMYHPAPGGVEYVELQNIGSSAINLNGAYFADSAPFSSQFTFGSITLQPGQFCVVTNDAAGFATQYGNNILVAGQYTGSLSNSGEPILLNDVAGNPIHDFTYEIAAPWPTTASGTGRSIEPLTTNPGLYVNGTNWRASLEPNGSPGFIGLGVDSDGDGTPDAIEAAFGSDPYNGNSQANTPVATRAGGAVTLTWGSVNGRVYTVEYRDELTTGTWQPLGTVTATGTTASYIDNTAPDTQRFYRLKLQFPQ